MQKTSGPLAVIGDVHGQAEPLRRLLGKLRKRWVFAGRTVVFLGDFLDRGPDPRAALELVLALQQEHPKVTAVMGNHDLALTGALGLVPAPPTCNWAKRWVAAYDAGSTFASYGVPFGDLRALARSIPPEHKQFLAGLPWLVEHPQYLIVHAGLVPDMPMGEQLAILRKRDFTLQRPPWLCDPALTRCGVPADCRLTVVSGHVRQRQVQFRDRRILLDTTGGVSGELSAVLLPERVVVTSTPSPVRVINTVSIAKRLAERRNPSNGSE